MASLRSRTFKTPPAALDTINVPGAGDGPRGNGRHKILEQHHTLRCVPLAKPYKLEFVTRSE